jgi:hypothetical protein
MANFYDRLQATANRLIAQYGKPATLIRQEQSGPAYDPVVTEQQYEVQLVETGYRMDNRNSTLVQVGDKIGIISTDGETPQLADKIMIDENRYNMIDVAPLNPGGTVLLFEMQARR